MPRSAVNLLPVHWWERDATFFKEIFDNFNVVGVIDVFGSANMAIACVNSEPPRPYLGLVRHQKHALVIQGHVDKYIMVEMGREGPPASKFYTAEVKELVARLFPPPKDVEAEDDDDEESEEGDAGDDE